VPADDEVLREDGDFILVRSASDSGRSHVLKLTGSLARLEHEFALRNELDAAWAAQPLSLVDEHGRTTLLLQDPGGEPLARLLGRPLEAEPFLRIAIGLTAALGRLHERRLIHKDVKPANALVRGATGDVWLTGFGVASRLPRERPAPEPPDTIAGTLAYMAPEQTGRMNRSVDSRSDLYALGVTFYEMATGALPFAASDSMEWVHCHIARQPIPPRERVESVPALLSAIVMKLLAKRAEDRYQTAAGLEADLRRGLRDLLRQGRLEPFALGAHDVPDRLVIPEALYGRERETLTLLEAFDDVLESGTPRLVLVSGHSGLGKSSVVNELHKALVPPRGLFASGKFDQYKRDIPYATLAQAFQSLIRPMLGLPEADLAAWRDEIQQALGPNGQLVVALVPELELIIGPQPAVPELPAQDAQNRFQMVFRNFLGVFAKKEHPLALFLDDLQWLDTATLKLIEHLVGHLGTRYLLLIGAYRTNEVGPSHPLMLTLDSIRKTQAKVSEILLAPLCVDDVGRLVADALHCEPARARSLSHLVHEKTAGNPFFVIQFLTTLAEKRLVDFDARTAVWRWDVQRIQGKGFTDNVVEQMIAKLKRLPGPTQHAMTLLACLGNLAEAGTLAIVGSSSVDELETALWEAVRAGFVMRVEGTYRFVHDRIQEAAYSLIPQTSAAVEQLDLAAVVETSQAVSGEIVLDRLIHRLLTVAVEHAGATRGLLILPRDAEQSIEAEATTDRDRVTVQLRQTAPTSAELPESVLRYVLRTRESVILDDASADDLFSGDEYVREKGSRSILCLPLLKQGQLIGVLYLENHLASHAFTPARLAVLKLLTSQAAISLENARLYSRLRQENAERARAEEELRKSEARWRAVFENSALGIALTDLSGRFVAVNLAYRSLLGYSEAELREMSFRMVTHEDDREHNVDLVAELIDGKRTSFDVVKRYLRKDAEPIWVNVSGSLVPGAEGVPQFILGIVENITERRKAEEALSLAQAELAHVSRVMTMGEMTASIAHEVNQPLAAIMTNGDACLKWLTRTPPELEKVRVALEQITLAAKRGSEVIRRIRALVRKTNAHKTSLDINDVAEEVAALVHGEARKHGVSLRTELAPALPAIEGDRIQLQQVILNLLMNGIEASQAVKDRPRELTIRSQPHPPDSVLVAVQDTGVGLDPGQMSRLFEVFFRTKPNGMGMGLSISRSIIEAHRGRLWASRNAGPGATFQFILPVRGT